MIKTAPFYLVFLASFLFAQSEVYENAFREALEDGKISKDEEKMLNSMQKSLGLEEDEVLEIRRRVAGSSETSVGLSRAGRWQVFWRNISYGNILYGFGIPYVLGVKSPNVYAGTQLLAAAGGFYFTWRYTKDMDIPRGRATFQNAGSVLGLASIYPLVMLVGFDNWISFDPDFKIGLTYMMAAVPAGIMLGDRLYRGWQPTDGQALAVIGAGVLSTFHALAAQLLVTPVAPEITENWLRLNSLLVYGGYLGGSYLGWRFISHETLTTGDASFLALGSALGLLTGSRLISITEASYKPAIITMLLSLDAVTYAAYRLGKGYDLTVGETAIVGLGSFAGYAAYRGLTLVVGMDQSGKGLMVGDIISYLAGGYLTFRLINPLNELSAGQRGSLQFSLSPGLWRVDRRLVPGLNASIGF